MQQFVEPMKMSLGRISLKVTSFISTRLLVLLVAAGFVRASHVTERRSVMSPAEKLRMLMKSPLNVKQEFR